MCLLFSFSIGVDQQSQCLGMKKSYNFRWFLDKACNQMYNITCEFDMQGNPSRLDTSYPCEGHTLRVLLNV